MNPHGFLHTPLKRARIPIPPLRHIILFNFQFCLVFVAEQPLSLLPSPRKIFNLSRRQSATTTHLLFNCQTHFLSSWHGYGFGLSAVAHCNTVTPSHTLCHSLCSASAMHYASHCSGCHYDTLFYSIFNFAFLLSLRTKRSNPLIFNFQTF